MILAITGATGFIGRRLSQRLLDDGHQVRALVRRDGHGLADGIVAVRGNLNDAGALETLASGADALVHLAGAVRGVDRAAFDAVNVAGTAAVIAALAAAAPSAHLLHVSSLAARMPELSDYSASKRAAEALVLNSDLTCRTVLRPTAVYGPGDVEFLPILQAMARGLAPVPMDPRHRISLIHVDDLIAALLAALHRPGRPQACFELCDAQQDGYDWPALAAQVEAHTGRRVRLVTVPRGVLSTIAGVNRSLARLTGRSPMLTPGKVREATHPDWSCDSTPFTTAYDWRPAIDLASGLTTILPPA